MPRKPLQIFAVERGSGQPWIRAFNLGGGWMVDYRLAAQEGRVVVAELRVWPSKGSVPAGGLTRRRLRSVAFGVHLDYFAQVAELSRGFPLKKGFPSVFEGPWADLAAVHYRTQPAPAAPSGAKRRGRPPITDEELVRAAAAYVAARARGSTRPVPDAARASKMSPPRMRDLVYRARHRGLLTRTMQGRGGGDLTPEARTLLVKVKRRMKRSARR